MSMAILSDEQRGLLKGLAIGLGAAFLVREILPPFRQALRPFVKAALKSGLHAVERGREKAAELGETLEDLVAEIKLEREIEALEATARSRTAASAAPSPAPAGEEA
jgi:hypothetical protein